MDFIDDHFSKKQARTVVFAVTLGNLLEWYEIYLYVYWAPIISHLFFENASVTANLTHTFLIFGVGFLARPIGGIVFGRIGDRIGRRKALILSIIMMTIPTFVTGFLPTYAMIGVSAPYILAIMRFLQAFPAGGEIPGAFCYLYESFPWRVRHYMCSWAVWGYQIGIFISTVECFLLGKYLSPEDLMQWGWRASFIVGGVLGLFGLVLRHRLHETPLFREMLTHTKITKEPITQVIRNNRKRIFQGILFCAMNSSTFYLLSIHFPSYFGKTFNLNNQDNLIITMIILLLITVTLPLFGKLADHHSNAKMLLLSVFGMVALIYPLYLAVEFASIPYTIIVMTAFCLLYTCTSALIPYIVSDLFSTHDRFTCTGLSFNLADSIIGGFTPVAALWLLQITNEPFSFAWILLFVAGLSFLGYLYLKPRRTPKHHT